MSVDDRFSFKANPGGRAQVTFLSSRAPLSLLASIKWGLLHGKAEHLRLQQKEIGLFSLVFTTVCFTFLLLWFPVAFTSFVFVPFPLLYYSLLYLPVLVQVILVFFEIWNPEKNENEGCCTFIWSLQCLWSRGALPAEALSLMKKKLKNPAMIQCQTLTYNIKNNSVNRHTYH